MSYELREEEVENSEVAKAVACFQGERELVMIGVKSKLKLFSECGDVKRVEGEPRVAKTQSMAGETRIAASALNRYRRTPLLLLLAVVWRRRNGCIHLMEEIANVFDGLCEVVEGCGVKGKGLFGGGHRLGMDVVVDVCRVDSMKV